MKKFCGYKYLNAKRSDHQNSKVYRMLNVASALMWISLGAGSFGIALAEYILSKRRKKEK
jgi:hypothetical protein